MSTSLFSENTSGSGSTDLSFESNIKINYGLFNGRKTTKGQLDLAPVPYSLTGFEMFNILTLSSCI